jgi:small conductance mechanosensitive channel
MQESGTQSQAPVEEVGGQILGQFDALVPLVTGWGLKVLGGVLVFVVGLMVAKSVRKGLVTLFDRTEMDETLEKFITRLGYYAVLTMTAVAALSMMGIQMASVLTILGAAGLAVGLAVQGTLSNVAAGVMLLIFRLFKVGDFVDAGGVSGTVDEIGLFATKLNTADNIHVIVPNSRIYGGTIKNYSRNDTRRNEIVIGISYEDDIGLAIKTIESVLDADDRVLGDPAPLVAVSELADSSVSLLIRPWSARSDYWALRLDLMRTLKEKLEAAGCSIPYPQQDVHLHKVD